MIIDFHSHVLPAIDDGSKNSAMSLEMLKESVTQGIDLIVLTPHFYATRQHLFRFLEERDNAYKKLLDAIDQAGMRAPELKLGAEVAYFKDISKAADLSALCIDQKGLLLLEMPFSPWDEEMITEVKQLLRKYRVILAHPERGLRFRENVKAIRQLYEMPVVFQVNASNYLNWLDRGKVKKNFQSRYVLGSDMHNMTERPQNIGAARKVIGPQGAEEIDALGQKLLKGVSV